MVDLLFVYQRLLSSFGWQGWWPLLEVDGINPTKSGSIRGYHPGEYAYPKTDGQRFEVCIGAILAQNTSWVNVERALMNLKNLDALSPAGILGLSDEKLKYAVRPAGYFNQKAKKLRLFANFFRQLSVHENYSSELLRSQLLSVWGIGDETADSILLYAYRRPVFVVDAYAKRIVCRLGLCGENVGYGELQDVFHKCLKKDAELYNEFHALLVELGKRHCTKSNPSCVSCPLLNYCDFGKNSVNLT